MSVYSISTWGLAGRRVPQGVLATMDELLFSGSEQGAWYDPSDMSTLFQDSAFTTPVTAVEQPVGSILDKSGRGNHATQATTTKRPVLSRRVNTLSTTQAVGCGTVTVITDAFGPGFDGLQLTRTAEGDEVYFVVNPSDVRGGSTYTLKVLLKKGGSTNPAQIVSFYTSAGGITVSVNWDSGNIASGAVSGGFTITNQSSVQLSADSYYVTLGCAVPAGVTSGTIARIYFWVGTLGVPGPIIGNPQFTLTTDAHLPYQRVNTATDYDADPSKFPAYLRFDGVDDALQTGNIDFTGTDKMTVVAGVRSNLNGYSNILELGPNSASENGFSLQRGWAANGDYAGIAYGTSLGYGYTSNFAAPDTSVIAAQYDIAQASVFGGEISFRRNGVVSAKAETQGSAGTGNFSQKPLYIGSRAGTSFPFNGRIYSLIVRGAQTPLSQIEATERYIKQKMRLP